MSSHFYPRTRVKKKNNTTMQENEVSIMSIPRRFRNKSPTEINSKEKEVQLVDTCSTRKQVEDAIEQEALERDSYYDDATTVELIKTTQELEKEINLGKIRELTDQLESNKILEKHLKEENQARKKNNARLVKENEK